MLPAKMLSLIQPLQKSQVINFYDFFKRCHLQISMHLLMEKVPLSHSVQMNGDEGEKQ